MPRGIYLDKILNHPNLSTKDNRIFRIFNLLLLVVIVLVVCIGLFLLILGFYPGVLMCIGEVAVFSILLYMHVKGHMFTSRYVFFIIAIFTQIFGSLYHGEGGGFDYLFFSTALTPVLFFEKKKHYFSLFIISIVTFIAVKHAYAYVEPIYPFERPISPYYVNIVISALLIYSGYVMFKKEHLKYEGELNSQREEIQTQNEALSDVQHQMHDLLQARTKKMEAQSDDLIRYADINAHIVRSPLARIMGLTNLAKYEDLKSDKLRKYYFEQLQYNAHDLDKALRQINQILSRHTDHEEPNEGLKKD
ncbi:hypothetical protein E1176_18105 [Fulvivirga sp. RKSG066]|uniref:hypothetical protein n=1 Tax=Fulvivirga aurantia TaxID=2529383 RepID=UPI0012BB5434|nr:hypothetical protein [Fulvivirga aurantia]MTI22949.1 hypothetical protein [Fulvivirga aurantia]